MIAPAARRRISTAASWERPAFSMQAKRTSGNGIRLLVALQVLESWTLAPATGRHGMSQPRKAGPCTAAVTSDRWFGAGSSPTHLATVPGPAAFAALAGAVNRRAA